MDSAKLLIDEDTHLKKIGLPEGVVTIFDMIFNDIAHQALVNYRKFLYLQWCANVQDTVTDIEVDEEVVEDLERNLWNSN